jgi:hypothetical protein
MAPARLFVTEHATTWAAIPVHPHAVSGHVRRAATFDAGADAEGQPERRPVRRARGAQRHGEFIAVSSAAHALARARKARNGRGRTCQAMFFNAPSIDGLRVSRASRVDRLDLDDGLGMLMVQSGIRCACHLFVAAPDTPDVPTGAA